MEGLFPLKNKYFGVFVLDGLNVLTRVPSGVRFLQMTVMLGLKYSRISAICNGMEPVCTNIQSTKIIL